MVAGNCSEKDIELAQEVISKGEVLIAVWKPKMAEVLFATQGDPDNIDNGCCSDESSPTTDHLINTLTILTNKKLYRHVTPRADRNICAEMEHMSGFVHLDDIESVKTMTGNYDNGSQSKPTHVALGGWSSNSREILNGTEAARYSTGGSYYMWFICDNPGAAARLITDAIDAIDDAGVDSIHERIGYLDALGIMMPVHMPQVETTA